jgi:hypothetical protein
MRRKSYVAWQTGVSFRAAAGENDVVLLDVRRAHALDDAGAHWMSGTRS